MKTITLSAIKIVFFLFIVYPVLPLKAQNKKMMGIETRTFLTPCSWVMISGLEGGYFTSNLTEYGIAERTKGSYFESEFISFAIGLKKIGGLGVGIKVWEGYKPSREDDESNINQGTPSSLFPIYLYYPIVISNLGKRPYFYHNFYSFLYFGGSGWGPKNNKYYNFGIKGGYNMVIAERVTGGIYIKVGYYHEYSGFYFDNNQGSLYFGIGFTIYNLMNARK